MANWALVGPFPFKSKIPSDWANDIDTYMTKVPNWVDGSDHTAAAQVILRGGELYVVDAFRADSARITVTTGKSFTVNSGSTFAVTSTGSITLVASSGTAATFTGNGSGYGINATGGATGGGAIFTAGGGNNIGCYGLGRGTEPGLQGLGGATGPGLIANPGTAQTNTAPTCAAKFAGYIQLTGTDPNATVDPGANNVLHAKMIPKAAVLIDSSYAVLDAYNVASVTNIAPNEYRVTFVRAMANVNYGIKFNVHGAPAYHGAHNGTKATTHFNFNIFKTDTLALGFGAATEAYIEVTGSQ